MWVYPPKRHKKVGQDYDTLLGRAARKQSFPQTKDFTFAGQLQRHLYLPRNKILGSETWRREYGVLAWRKTMNVILW